MHQILHLSAPNSSSLTTYATPPTLSPSSQIYTAAQFAIARMPIDITPQSLLSIPSPRSLSLSPDAKHVVYALRPALVKTTPHVTSSQWLAAISSLSSARQLTRGNYDDSSPTFSPDGGSVAFISDREEPGKASVLYLLPLQSNPSGDQEAEKGKGNVRGLAGGEAKPITDVTNRQSIHEYAWDPSGRAARIAFLSADEKPSKPSVTAKASKENPKEDSNDTSDVQVFGQGWEVACLRVVNVESSGGSIEVRTFDMRGHVGGLAWSDNGEKIVYVTYKTPLLDDKYLYGASIWILHVGTGESRYLCDFGGAVRDLSWTKEGIWFTGAYEPTPQTNATCAAALYSLVVPGSERLEGPAYGQTCCVQALKATRQGNVVVQLARGLEEMLVVVGALTDVDRDQGEEAGVLYSGKHTIISWDANMSTEKPVVVLAKSYVGKPPEVFSLVDGHEVQLSNHKAEIAQMGFGTSHLCEYETSDGVPIDGYYAIPKSLQSAFERREPQKTIVLVHGGPYHRTTDSWDVDFQFCPWFLANDYLVLCPNYRGGSGHGNDYAKTVRGDPAVSYDDVIWLVKKGVEDGNIDEKRCAIVGWSQGGYMAYLSVTRDSTFHFAAAVAGAGVSDWHTMVLTSDMSTFEAQLAGTKPWDTTADNAVGRRGSPLYHMHDIRTPMLLIHGQEDVRVPVAQATAFHKGMRELGKECEMAIYPREGHGNPEPFEMAHMADILKRMLAFLKKHME